MIHTHKNEALLAYAPFSNEEISAINGYQLSAPYPYICKKCGGIQLAKKDGMSCVESHVLRTSIVLHEKERVAYL